MRRVQKPLLLGFFLTLLLTYQNCGKMNFSDSAGGSSTINQIPTSSTTPNNPNLTPSTPVVPSSPTITFNNLNEPATIAFNDNYPAAGDSDYNDFVVNVNVSESYDSSGALTKIVAQYIPKYRISGADHQFVLVFDGSVRGRNGFVSNVKNFVSQPMFAGSANIDYELSSKNGQNIAHESNHDKSTDLIVFPSTATATNNQQVATITITNLDPTLNTYALRGALSIKRYRSVLHNNTSDIDISDIDPSFVDKGGAPCGFFVPVNWRPPKESQSIFPAYPEFKGHALYIMSGAALDQEPADTSEWFNHIGDASLLLP